MHKSQRDRTQEEQERLSDADELFEREEKEDSWNDQDEIEDGTGGDDENNLELNDEDPQAKFVAMQNTNACEHWSEEDWHRYCQYVGYPPSNTSQDSMVPVIGLRRTLFKHQLIASMWMIEQERGACEGGWNADDMGLGKTTEALFTAYFSMAHDSAWMDIRRSREAKDGYQLAKTSDTYRQSESDLCPSQANLPFLCPCQEFKLTAGDINSASQPASCEKFRKARKNS